MQAYVLDWLNLLGRWLHLIAGIAWVGASFYFVWLDNHLLEPNDEGVKAKGVGGEVWAVHGGGFYNAQKYTVAPAVLPGTLHWFKWEAYVTWLSGFFMLCVVYYVQADAYLIDKSVADIGKIAAISIGIAALAGGWTVYHCLCESQLAKQPRLLAGAIALMLVVAAYGLCHVFSGRGAYIHFGAILGTIMVANVFFVIIPGQRELVDAKRQGREPDPIHGQRGKLRSVHNTYFTLPVLLTMISNHYAMIWGAPHNWVLLLALTAAGAAIRVYFVGRHKQHAGGRASPVPAIVGVALLGGVAFAIAPAKPVARTSSPQEDPHAAAAAEFAHVQSIVGERCVACHAAVPTQPGIPAPPKGVRFDSPERILAQTAQMRQQIATRAMPLGNLTQMTDDERSAVIDWIDGGARH